MSAPQLSLLARRRFLPLFATQFLGAFNDNLYRSAMLFLVSFSLYRDDTGKAALIAVVSGGVFILPYFLFSSIAGQLADRMDKGQLARAVKLAEIGIMVVGWLALHGHSVTLLMTVLFAMGIHSTVFGPVKYSMLPQHLSEQELMGGTGLVEAGTFLAILLGQIAGGLMTTDLATLVLIGAAILGLCASLFIPPAPAGADRPPVEANLVRSTMAIVGHARANRPLFRTILGISWFFALGAVLTQQFVPLVRSLNAAPEVGALFLGLFSIGVALGSLLVSRLLAGEISARYVPVSATILALAVIDLGVTVLRMRPTAMMTDASDFLRQPEHWNLIADLVVTAMAGGVFIVPLYALLQTLGDAASRSRDVAANNIVNAVAMVGVTVVVAGLAAIGCVIGTIFIALGLAGLVVALLAYRSRVA